MTPCLDRAALKVNWNTQKNWLLPFSVETLHALREILPEMKPLTCNFNFDFTSRNAVIRFIKYEINIALTYKKVVGLGFPKSVGMYNSSILAYAYISLYFVVSAWKILSMINHDIF